MQHLQAFPHKSALRLCLSQLLDECLDADFKYAALHIRLAILELEGNEQIDSVTHFQAV